MTTLTCPSCDHTQEVEIVVDVYIVVCEVCGAHFRIPREHRVKKRTIREWKSDAAVYVRTSVDVSNTMTVSWAVETDEGDIVEQDAATVDVSGHKPHARGVIGLVRVLQSLGRYRDARVFVDEPSVIHTLSSDAPRDDVLDRICKRALALIDDRFRDCELAVHRHVVGNEKPSV